MKYTHYGTWEEYKTTFTDQFPLDGDYVACGVGEGFRALLELFPEVNIRYCLDARAEELRGAGRKILPYEALSGSETAEQKFIITAGGEYHAEIKNSLLHYGVKAEHICSLQEILFFWGMYGRGKLLSTGCNVFLLTNCNLKCRGCAQFTPYIQRHRYNPVTEVEESLNAYFRVFDYVKDLILVGGETMLYRELGTLCAYIHEHFSDRYHELKLFTNGLILPPAEVLDGIAGTPRAHVMISDYTCSIQEKESKLIAALEERRIRYTLNNQFGRSGEEYLWFDLGNPTEPKGGDAAAVKSRFEKCSLVCQNLIDRKLYYCVPACAAMMGEINVLDDADMQLDLNELERLNPAERADRIGKFNLGFPNKGCLEFCRFCNGFGRDINQRFVRAGEQC